MNATTIATSSVPGERSRHPLLALARKEAGELLASGRGLAWLLALTAVLSAFGLLLVSDTELSLLDNAQVVYAMLGIITALGALLALVVGGDSVAGERERGSLVALLLTPMPRTRILLGKLGGLAIAWMVMYALALPYLWAVGSTGQNLLYGLLCLALLGTPVVLGFGCFAMGLGARLGSTRSSLLSGLIVLLLAASPLLLGPRLRQSTIGQLLDAVNPFAAALNAYDAVIVDSEGLAAQAGHGAVTIIWLALALWFAWRGFRRINF